MQKLFFGMDITRAGEPVYSIHVDNLEFAVVPSLEGHCFRIEDKKVPISCPAPFLLPAFPCSHSLLPISALL